MVIAAAGHGRHGDGSRHELALTAVARGIGRRHESDAGGRRLRPAIRAVAAALVVAPLDPVVAAAPAAAVMAAAVMAAAAAVVAVVGAGSAAAARGTVPERARGVGGTSGDADEGDEGDEGGDELHVVVVVFVDSVMGCIIVARGIFFATPGKVAGSAGAGEGVEGGVESS